MGRVWVRAAAAAATSLGLGGCLVINGAFDPGDGGASQSSSGTVSTGGSGETGTVTGTGMSTSTGSVSEGTGSDATSSEPTSGESTTDESTTAVTVTDTSDTSGTSGTSGMSTEGESSTGQGACAGDEGDMCTSQQIAGQTYVICERTETWEQARQTCEGRCAQLVILEEPESAEVYAALRLQMTADDILQEQNGGDQTVMTRASWWLGGRKVDGTYLWLDGTPMPPKGTGGWYSNDPDMPGPVGCAVLGVFGKGDANGKWFDRECDALYRSICEPL